MTILILSNLTSYTYNFRLEIIEKLLSEGHSITIACHNDDQRKNEHLEKIGCRTIEVPFNGKGTDIKEELSLIRTYSKILKSQRPDIVLTFTIKMNLYGGLVSSLRKTEFIPMITGLGELEKKGKLRAILLSLHKIVMPKAKCVIFQNEDNREFFRTHGIRTKKDIVVPGSGVNLTNFPLTEYPKENPIVFSFIGRLTYAKGIDNFLDAAETLSSESVSFHAAGPIDSSYTDRVKDLCSKRKLHYEGVLSDVRPLLEKSSCIVLPTFHPEGISNVLLEAAAMGRPAICTARTGCKEIVEDGVNGFYCNPKDSENLIEVISRFSSLHLSRRKEMGLASRRVVEARFDRRIVVDAYLEVISK